MEPTMMNILLYSSVGFVTGYVTGYVMFIGLNAPTVCHVRPDWILCLIILDIMDRIAAWIMRLWHLITSWYRSIV